MSLCPVKKSFAERVLMVRMNNKPYKVLGCGSTSNGLRLRRCFLPHLSALRHESNEAGWRMSVVSETDFVLTFVQALAEVSL